MYYFVANILIKNIKQYQKYLDGVDEVFSKYHGKYLAVDNKPMVLEGNWNYERAVIIEFKTKNDFESWYNSNDYQDILKFRLQSSNCDTILIKGEVD